jgi:dTDP-4-dehydrorhamnose reductase
MTNKKKPPKTFVIGANGFIGSKILKGYKKYYPDCNGSSRNPINGQYYLNLKYPNFDLSKILNEGYREVIIAAAITNFEKCEKEKEESSLVNVIGTLEIAFQCSKAGLKVIFFSSESVFDGLNGGYDDFSFPHPIFEYGRQKAEVEKKLKEICGNNYLILRIGKTFGLDKGDNTLFDDWSQKLIKNQPISALRDQQFCPTLIDDILKSLFLLQIVGAKGLVNVCSPEIWIRYNLALEFTKLMKKNVSLVKPMLFSDFKEEFQRPRKTNMICKRLYELIDFSFTEMNLCMQTVINNY